MMLMKTVKIMIIKIEKQPQIPDSAPGAVLPHVVQFEYTPRCQIPAAPRLVTEFMTPFRVVTPGHYVQTWHQP